MTYDWYLKTRFGGKVAKVSLDIGCTCPNMDGMKGFGGCIYCSGRGSADFAAPSSLPVKVQLDRAKEMISSQVA